jgi:hypothetical protein
MKPFSRRNLKIGNYAMAGPRNAIAGFAGPANMLGSCSTSASSLQQPRLPLRVTGHGAANEPRRLVSRMSGAFVILEACALRRASNIWDI